jgi:hypothetical protein
MNKMKESKSLLQQSGMFIPNAESKARTIIKIKRRELDSSISNQSHEEEYFAILIKRVFAAAALILFGVGLGLRNPGPTEGYSIENFRQMAAYIMRSETVRQIGDAFDSLTEESKENL